MCDHRVLDSVRIGCNLVCFAMLKLVGFGGLVKWFGLSVCLGWVS